jgi:hypothetical protein
MHEACNDCAAACSQCASACLREPDVKSMARCIALDMECTDICRLAAASMSRDGDFASAICGVFADVCEACGDECARHPIDHCQECAKACQRCARECRKMAGQASAKGAGTGSRTHAH